MAISTDTTGKDFDSIVDSLIDFASIQYGESTSANRVWSDFNISSFSRNWAELVAYVGDQLMFYMDTQANQAYLRSATIPSFIVDIANQLGYEVPTQQASSGKVTLTFSGPATLDAYYPVFAGNTQYITTRQVVANQAGDYTVNAIQGARFTESFTADGIQKEEFILNETDIIVDLTNSNSELRSPIVSVNGTIYDVVLTQVDSAPNSTSVVRKELPDGRTKLVFGDGIFGRKLVENESVSIIYRTLGGTVGNIEAGEINTLGLVVTNLDSVTNEASFSGGVDRLNLQQIKDRTSLSLKTVAGAVSLPDFADILVANFPQVLRANAALNTVDTGIDINIHVLPNSDSVTNITDNSLLFNTLTDFIERRKVVGTQFLIKDAQSIFLLISLEVFLNSDASRSDVEANIRAKVASLFDLQTGGVDGQGINFEQVVKVSDLFEALKDVEGISRFEINKHTVIPRVEEYVASPNQDFYISKVETYSNADNNEWLVCTSEIASPEPSNGQVGYKVFKRTRGSVTSLNTDSVTDSNLDLTLIKGTGVVVGGVTMTDSENVFTPNQYDNQLLVDSSNNIFQIQETKSGSIVLTSPSLTDAAITTATSGEYRIVKSFSGQQLGIGGASFSILYNNKNTFFSQGANFDLISIIKSPFILSEEQSNTGTYGVPTSISSVTPAGSNPGDLVSVTFNSNPNLSQVTNDYTLVDSQGVVFDIDSIADNDSAVASYNNSALADDTIELTNVGDDSAIAIAFVSSKTVTDGFLDITVNMQRVSNPLGSVLVEIREDNAGVPGALILASNLVSASTVSNGTPSDISFNFPSEISLVQGSKYHLVVASDSAYKTSYNNGNGAVLVSIDTSTLQYSPAETASGIISIASTGLDILTSSTGSIEVVDNFLRSTQQATMLITLSDNASFTTGTNSITIGGQPFLAVAGAPAPSGEFQVGGTLTNTRDNLSSAITAQASDLVTVSNISTNQILLTAEVTNYKGSLGNDIAVEIVDQGTQNFDTGGLTSLVGGINGDSVTIRSPQFVNSSEVEYAYDDVTGVIQFSSPVILPTFQDGDTFKDGAGNEFDIISISDASDTVTISSGEVVDVTINRMSGSIHRSFTYIFGEDVSVGVDSDATAANLAAVIDAQPYVSASSTLSVVDITSDVLGDAGNAITLEKDDAGQANLELSGETLTGGLDGDIVAVDGIEFYPVLGAPATDNEFEVDIGSINNTLANLEQAIDNHPSLIGVVTAATLVGSQSVQITSSVAGIVGNDITLDLVNDSSGNISISGANFTGGVDNLSVQSFNDVAWSTRVPDSDLIFNIGVAVDSLVVVSKTDANGNQVIPAISVGGVFDSGLGKRYYSDNSEVSFTIVTKTPNSLIIGGEQIDIFGTGVNGGVRVNMDRFIFRTSRPDDDITNLRESEIPVMSDSNLKINLLGGVN